MSKKVIFIRNAYDFDFGGGERMPVNIASEIKKYGLEPMIISRNSRLLNYCSEMGVKSQKGLWWSRQDWGGGFVVLLPIYLIWLFVVFLWYTLVFLRQRPSVVHIQSRDDFISATLAAKLLGKKVIWSDHADLKYIYVNHKSWYKNPIGKIVYLISRLTSLVIMTGKSDLRLTENQLGHKLPGNYKIIYNGVFDKPELQATKKQKKITFVATSRLVTSKGIGELIEAFNNLSRVYENIELWLLGEGPEENKFKKLAENNNHIKFLGFPKNSLDIASQTHIFVHPSYLEGFSISLIEATMIGLPVIACDVGGNPEIINNKNGILVKEKDSESLQKAMEKLIINSNLRKKMSLNSRETYEKDFNLSNIVKDRYIPIYEK